MSNPVYLVTRKCIQCDEDATIDELCEVCYRRKGVINMDILKFALEKLGTTYEDICDTYMKERSAKVVECPFKCKGPCYIYGGPEDEFDYTDHILFSCPLLVNSQHYLPALKAHNINLKAKFIFRGDYHTEESTLWDFIYKLGPSTLSRFNIPLIIELVKERVPIGLFCRGYSNILEELITNRILETPEIVPWLPDLFKYCWSMDQIINRLTCETIVTEIMKNLRSHPNTFVALLKSGLDLSNHIKLSGGRFITLGQIINYILDNRSEQLIPIDIMLTSVPIAHIRLNLNNDEINRVCEHLKVNSLIEIYTLKRISTRQIWKNKIDVSLLPKGLFD